MSYYSSFGITVCPKAAPIFLKMLGDLDDSPVYLNRDDDGSVTAVWESVNHFDDSEIKRTIDRFIDIVDYDDYAWEIIYEDRESETDGGYFFRFSTRIVYDVYGTPIEESRPKKSFSLRRR